ncbi:phosphate acetyltransferase [Alkanindiges sp. WGS2144]|uniref:phosphate acetyltransferase n=1 Tax=Alkanindiges sp. WGS2144 TaxID=3366808 RepID=UPI0037509C5D
MKTFLLIPSGEGVGLTSACLGLIHALDCLGIKAGFLKPFVQSEPNSNGPDRSSALVGRTFNLNPPPAIGQHQVERMLGDNQLDELLEKVVSLHRNAAQDKDIVVVEGIVPTGEASYAAQLNSALAQALDAQVILVTTADINQAEALADRIDMHLRPYGGTASSRAVGVILMRVCGLPSSDPLIPLATDNSLRLTEPLNELIQQVQPFSPLVGTKKFPIIGLVPFSSVLSVPRTLDVADAIGARWLNTGDAEKRRVQRSTLTARTVSNALSSFKPGTLIVTPGDRDDLLVAAALSTMNGMPLAGVLLTGGYMPSEEIIELCRPALKTGLPVLSVDTDSYETVSRLSRMSNEIPSDDLERAEQVTHFVSSHIDLDWLKVHTALDYVTRLSPSAFRHELVQLALAQRKRIVLPEGSEPRTIQAAVICQARGIAQCVLLAKREEVETIAEARGIELPDDLEIIDPDTIRQRYIAPMVERRKGKLTEPMAEAQLQDSVVLGTMMLALGEVDGLVSGAIHTTANTVRPAFQLIKTAPGYSLVSSVFFMLLPDQVVVYGDCAINPNPNAEELAEIALQSADSAQAFGIEPRVAMISYSTGESGSGSEVDKVRQATQIARQRRPDLIIDGPLQYDAAAIESVGQQKAPNSPVAGRATVFIFPDLNTGNTTYKAVQRSANVLSVGPMLQGLNKPVNDLSRGALIDDIVYTIALTAIQAMQPNNTDNNM